MMLLFWLVMTRVREVIVSFLSLLYCGDWGSKCIKYSGLVTKYVNKVLLGFPSSRLSELTFLEFHFETEVKVDFPSACI